MAIAQRVVTRLTDLDDFEGTPVDGNVPTYNDQTGKWEPSTPPGGGGPDPLGLVQGGNAFGEELVVGSTDDQPVSVIANNTKIMDFTDTTAHISGDLMVDGTYPTPDLSGYATTSALSAEATTRASADTANASALTAHVAAADPHTQYAQESALGDAAYKNTGASAGQVAAGDHTHAGGSGAPTTSKYVLGAADASLTNGIVIPSFVGHPDIVPASPNAMDDEFDAGSLDAKWTTLGGGTGRSLSVASSRLVLTSTSGGTANQRLYGVYQTAPSAPWEFVTKVTNNSWTYGYPGFWMFVRNSSNSRITAGGINAYNGGVGLTLVSNLSDPNTWIADPKAGDLYPYSTMYCKIANDGTNLTWYGSRDGLTYVTLHSVAISNYVTTVNQVGVGIMPYNVASAFSFDFFRRTA